MPNIQRVLLDRHRDSVSGFGSDSLLSGWHHWLLLGQRRRLRDLFQLLLHLFSRHSLRFDLSDCGRLHLAILYHLYRLRCDQGRLGSLNRFFYLLFCLHGGRAGDFGCDHRSRSNGNGLRGLRAHCSGRNLVLLLSDRLGFMLYWPLHRLLLEDLDRFNVLDRRRFHLMTMHQLASQL